MAKKLDDPDPSRWLTPEEFKARLDTIPEPGACLADRHVKIMGVTLADRVN